MLRRASHTSPLRLVGVTVAGAFYPRSTRDATGPLSLTKGLVALAPLTAVDAPDAGEAAALAGGDAHDCWGDLGASSPA